MKKRAILTALFTVGSGLFSAWRFYKDYTFKRNLRRTLHHIINDGKHFRQGILSNRRNLVSLADITASNFKFLREKFEGLRNMTFEYFQSYTSSLLATNADAIFNKNYLLYYVNTVDKVNTDLSQVAN